MLVGEEFVVESFPASSTHRPYWTKETGRERKQNSAISSHGREEGGDGSWRGHALCRLCYGHHHLLGGLWRASGADHVGTLRRRVFQSLRLPGALQSACGDNVRGHYGGSEGGKLRRHSATR